VDFSAWFAMPSTMQAIANIEVAVQIAQYIAHERARIFQRMARWPRASGEIYENNPP
jgi:hypothetical protein